jgi:hypothetical protein
MSVGNQMTSEFIDGRLSSLAIQMRELMHDIVDLSTNVNGQGNGLAVLENAGYSSDANPDNPNSESDAALAQAMIAYFNTIAEVYYGTATQDSEFDFDQELSQLWAGQ